MRVRNPALRPRVRALLGLIAALACGLALVGCASKGRSGSATGAAIPTAPPPQTPPAAVTPLTDIVSTPAPPPPEVAAIVQRVKVSITELPPGYSYGAFQAYQPNDQALNGYDESPKSLLERMNRTGRLGGYIQQLFTGDGPSGMGVSIDVWRDVAGAKEFFDDFPRPSKEVKWEEISTPQPLGQQVFAYKYTLPGPSGTTAGYSITWRNGRLILGVGEAFVPGHESLDKLMTIATLMDRKATAAQQ